MSLYVFNSCLHYIFNSSVDNSMDSQGNLRRARLIKTCLLPLAFLSMVSRLFTFRLKINVVQMELQRVKRVINIALCVSLLHVDASPIVYLSFLNAVLQRKMFCRDLIQGLED